MGKKRRDGRRSSGPSFWAAVMLAAALAAGCAEGASYASAGYAPEVGEATSAGYGGFDDDGVLDSAPAQAAYGRGVDVRDRVAANAAPPPGAHAAGVPVPQTATDATPSRSLIIYTAQVVLAIYEVDATQRRVVAEAEAVGGFVASLDASTVVVRIPAANFAAFLDVIESTGRVVGRTIQANDITEQFRDLEVRIQNLVAMRARLEQMLERAANVQEALAVERELERVTGELESLRGRLRYLSDRVAFSTVTIQFRALPREELTNDAPPPPPVPWIRAIGLGNLLRN